MIFILGGNGFVGSAFVRYCVKLGLAHRVLTRDTYAEHRGQSCDIFVNANGNSRKPLAVKEPMTDFDASVRSVRASLCDFKIGKYIHLSSCDVYPDCSSSEKTSEDTQIDPAQQGPYGFHKWMAEQCVVHGAKEWLICRLGGFVGPGLKKNAIFDILQGGPLWLDAQSELQFMHTDDCAKIVMALAPTLNRQVINVCGQGTLKLADIMQSSGRTVAVQPGSPRVRYEVNIGKLMRYCDVPKSETTVHAFVKEELRK